MKLTNFVEFDIVIIVVDSVSKRAYFISTYTIVTVEGITKLFLYNTWKFYGLSTHVVLNRELQFMVLFTKKLYCLLSVKIALSIVWYSQLDS